MITNLARTEKRARYSYFKERVQQILQKQKKCIKKKLIKTNEPCQPYQPNQPYGSADTVRLVRFGAADGLVLGCDLRGHVVFE
ncbi:hypothetical protein BpHYR1_016364 [Brachionus plicatilis]|uniref:Uncharacterized protein n=1 Tax=Brachionus plicatilis TaxID=10195 RepID=A0A3M7REB9_BRAPC|nr:hypothetical protein BpHYR1_016364 [Brachionus plicatilis]